MGTEFKPTRRELADVRRFADEVEHYAWRIPLLLAHGQTVNFEVTRAHDYSRLAFSLAGNVAERGRA